MIRRSDHPIQMIRLSCRADWRGQPCGYRLEIEANLEAWARDVFLRHMKRRHPERIHEEKTTPIAAGAEEARGAEETPTTGQTKARP
jgi:hypothetical protein